MSGNPNHISGIYNYCDRWCERCPFTSRCQVYELDQQSFPDPEGRDIRNAQFWEKLQEIFQSTIEMLDRMAEEQGIDLSDVDTAAIADERAEIDEEAKSEPCVRTAEQYGKTVNTWFDASKDLFRQKGDQIELEARTELPGADPEAEAADLQDAVEVIRWYQHQIYVKLMRASSGDLKRMPEGLEDYPRDSDGSAKVALIATDRSIAAWGSLQNHFPDQADDLLDILVTLDRIRRMTEARFPDARAFVRPGFDE